MDNNSPDRYYQKNKGREKKKVRERYKNLSEKEEEKKHQCGRERFKNLQEYENKFWLIIEKAILKCKRVSSNSFSNLLQNIF